MGAGDVTVDKDVTECGCRIARAERGAVPASLLMRCVVNLPRRVDWGVREDWMF